MSSVTHGPRRESAVVGPILKSMSSQVLRMSQSVVRRAILGTWTRERGDLGQRAESNFLFSQPETMKAGNKNPSILEPLITQGVSSNL